MTEAKNVWVIKQDKLEECPHAPTPNLYVCREVHESILFLMQEIVGLEWMGYLVGEDLEDGDIHITGLQIPRQEVTSTSVDVRGWATGTQVRGTVHSHVKMGTFWSGWDDDTLRSNHDVNIVVSKDKPMLGSTRFKAPCGAYSMQLADIVLEEVSSDFDDTVNAYDLPLDMIKEKTYTKVVCSYGSRSGGIYGGYQQRFHQSDLITPEEQARRDAEDDEWWARFGDKYGDIFLH